MEVLVIEHDPIEQSEYQRCAREIPGMELTVVRDAILLEEAAVLAQWDAVVLNLEFGGTDKGGAAALTALRDAGIRGKPVILVVSGAERFGIHHERAGRMGVHKILLRAQSGFCARRVLEIVCRDRKGISRHTADSLCTPAMAVGSCVR